LGREAKTKRRSNTVRAGCPRPRRARRPRYVALIRASYRLVLLLCLVPCLAGPAFAHVGSPDVFFEGNAGPYRLFVTVRLPQVIPGVAEIEIRSESSDVREVRIVPLRLTGPGSQYAPTPDLTRRSGKDPQFFAGSLWLMEGGSLQVRVQAEGERGKGEVSVPVPSTVQRVLPVPRGLGVVLFAFMVLLGAGVVSIAGAAVREGELEPGEAPTPSQAHKARRVMAFAAVLVAGSGLPGRAMVDPGSQELRRQRLQAATYLGRA
jgi:hypothetical protein